MMLARPPRPTLRPFVEALWVSEGRPGAARQRALPTGAALVSFSLSEQAFAVFDGDTREDGAGRSRPVGHAVISGPWTTYYDRDTSVAVPSAAALLRPGTVGLLAGVPAHQLTDRHTDLQTLWGDAAIAARARLRSAADPGAVLDELEATLVERLPGVAAIHPAVARALEHFERAADVEAVVTASGYSHRAFVALFRRSVGLTPKAFARIQRFQRTLVPAGRSDAALGSIAARAEFSDQSHMNRDFREFAGMSPGRYRRLAPDRPWHLPLADGES